MEANKCIPLTLDDEMYTYKMRDMKEKSIKIYEDNIEEIKRYIDETYANIEYNKRVVSENLSSPYGSSEYVRLGREYIAKDYASIEESNKEIEKIKGFIKLEKAEEWGSTSNSIGVTDNGSIYLRAYDGISFIDLYMTYAHELQHCVSWQERTGIPQFLEEGIADYFAQKYINSALRNKYKVAYEDEIKMVQHLLRYISEDDLISMYYSKDVSVACGAWEEISEHSCLEITQLGEKVHLNMTPLSSYMGLFNRSD